MASRHAQMVSGATTRSNSPGCGYESPNEDNHSHLFRSSPPTPTTQRPDGSASAFGQRPTFATRPSYVATTPQPSVSFHTPGSPNQPSLDDMMAKAENLLPNDKVSFKDRIACYKWTYFTMVSTFELPQRILTPANADTRLLDNGNWWHSQRASCMYVFSIY